MINVFVKMDRGVNLLINCFECFLNFLMMDLRFLVFNVR